MWKVLKGGFFVTARKKNAFFVLAISVFMALIRLIIVSANLEKYNEQSDIYYLPKNFTVVSFNVISVALIAAFFFVALKYGKKPSIKFDDSNISVSVGSLITAFSLLGTVVIFFFTAFSTDPSPMPLNINEPEFPQQNFSNEPSLLQIAVVAFAVAAALKFFMFGIRNHNTEFIEGTSVAILNLFPIAFSALRLLSDFISSSAVPFASSGGYRIVSLVAVLMFFYTEGKAYVTETSCVLPDFYGYSAFYLLSVYSLPNLVLHCFGTFAFDTAAAFSLTDIGIAVYIILKLISSKSAKPSKKR